MSKILITGASGFIGSFLVEQGLYEGHTIYAALRQSSSTKYLTDNRVNIIYLNLKDKQSLVHSWTQLREQIGRFDYVIHNAGATQVLNTADFDTINYQFTRNLVESLCEVQMIPDKFIFVSSLAAYGPGSKTTLSPILSSDTPAPITWYGKSKLKAEQFLFQQRQMSFLIFRPTGVYGPRNTGYFKYFSAINRHIEMYIGSAHQMLSFIYVKDLAHLIFQSLRSSIYNRGYFVTDGKTYSSKQFADITKKVLQKKTVPILIPGILIKWLAIILERIAFMMNKTPFINRDKYKEITQKNWSCDSRETMADFDFSPEYDLQRGVKETIEWYKENRWL